MNKCEGRILQLSKEVADVDVVTAYKMQQQGATIIDVRSLLEFEESHIASVKYIGRDFLEFRIEKIVADINSPVIVSCGGGVRSLFAAESLKKLGYDNVYNMSGGFKAWQDARLPVDKNS